MNDWIAANFILFDAAPAGKKGRKGDHHHMENGALAEDGKVDFLQRPHFLRVAGESEERLRHKKGQQPEQEA